MRSKQITNSYSQVASHKEIKLLLHFVPLVRSWTMSKPNISSPFLELTNTHAMWTNFLLKETKTCRKYCTEGNIRVGFYFCYICNFCQTGNSVPCQEENLAVSSVFVGCTFPATALMNFFL